MVVFGQNISCNSLMLELSDFHLERLTYQNLIFIVVTP